MHIVLHDAKPYKHTQTLPYKKFKIYDISKTAFQYQPIAKQLYYIAHPVSIGKMHNVFKVIKAV